MAKLDRLVWVGGSCWTAYGLSIGIRMNALEALPRLGARVPSGWPTAASAKVDLLYSVILGGASPNPGIRRYNLLYRGAARLARTMNSEELLDVFDADVRLSVAELARRRVFVHAGVVGWRGSAILLPGPTHSGKSTLVAELVRAGATYYSDEYAVLDAYGRVYPFADKLSLRQSNGQRPHRITAEELGGVTGTVPLPVGLIVVTKFRAGTRWRPRTLSPGNAILSLLINTVPARRKPRTVLAALRAAVAHARLVKGARDDASSVIEYLLNTFDTRHSRVPAEVAHASQKTRS